MPQLDAVDERQILERFGNNVRKLRKVRSFSQEQLAAEAELDRTYMGGVERGERNLGLLNVTRIARALGVSAAELCEGIDR